MNKSMPTTQAVKPQGRPRKKPEYNANTILSALIDAVTDRYLSPSEDEAVDGHKPIKLVAEEFGITPLKVRKLLITGGAYRTPISEQILALHHEGNTIAQIQETTGLSRASVHSYLPYRKGIYNAAELSTDAERIRLYRDRKAGLEELRNEKIDLWIVVELFAGYPFYTDKKLKFSYTVKGNELFVNRKKESITRVTVDLAYQRVLEEDGKISGPNQIDTFGASFLYPMFVRFGIIHVTAKQTNML